VFFSKRSTLSIALTAALLVPLSACGNGSIGTTIQQALSADPNADRWGQEASVKLPEDFPPELRYPNARLQEVSPAAGQVTDVPNSQPSGEPVAANLENSNKQRLTRWVTADTNTQVLDFYQKLFQSSGWSLDPSANGDENTLVAQREDLQVKVSVPNQPIPSPTSPGSPLGGSSPPANTEFVIEYARGVAAAKPAQPQASGPDPAQQLSGLGQAPKELQPYLEDLAELGVLTPDASSESTFQPNKTVTRSEFARWLVEANNRIYQDQPGRQIRPVPQATQPAFEDVPPSDPAFSYIQGLAEAGYIPSSLTGETNANRFQPNAPLTREELLLWKVPIDLRRILPTATLDSIRQTWGFQDANRISPKALRAIAADHQNGDLSNIRRVFGSTLLFQPQKTVTRAEAAAALWYVGSQGEGLSAEDVLEAQGNAAAPEAAPLEPSDRAGN